MGAKVGVSPRDDRLNMLAVLGVIQELDDLLWDRVVLIAPTIGWSHKNAICVMRVAGGLAQWDRNPLAGNS